MKLRRGGLAPSAASGWDLATLLLLLAALAFVLATFDAHGISNDEPVQHRYGQLLLDYYRSGLEDRRLFEYINLYHYGGLFDMIAAGLAPHVPYDVWDLRHLLSGLFGLSGLVAVAWLGRMLGGARTGFVAALLLALCGSWTGTMFTHTKDIPFAVTTIWSVAFATRLVQQLPRPRPVIIVGTGLAMGAALGLRYGGILLPAYLGLCLLLALARGLPWPALWRLWPVPVLTLSMMGFFWPWSVTGWDHFLITVRTFSHFDFDLNTLLDGEYIPAREIPASYLFRYLLRSLPEVFLLGLAVPLLLLVARVVRRGPGWPADPLPLAPLVLSLLVPFGVVVLTAPALYNGIRHFTFVLPSLAVVAALGLDRLAVRLAGWPRLRLSIAAVLLVLAVDALALLWRLHPYEYVGYNRLSGGVRAAYGRWELDYWNDAMRAAAQQLNARVAREGADPGHRYLVAICAEPVQGMHYLDRHFVATRDWPRADFFLASTSTRCDRALQGEIVATIEREGVPLVVVKDRRGLPGHERGVRDD